MDWLSCVVLNNEKSCCLCAEVGMIDFDFSSELESECDKTFSSLDEILAYNNNNRMFSNDQYSWFHYIKAQTCYIHQQNRGVDFPSKGCQFLG